MSAPTTAAPVAYLGPAGTHTHAAARSLFGAGGAELPLPTIPAVFDAVEQGRARVGVVPIENSTEGSVTSTLDALLESPLRIGAECALPVRHQLVSRASNLAAVRVVVSHPQALAQCRRWLAAHLPEAEQRAAASTAAAAREAAADPGVAALASQLAADLHALPVLGRDVQDRDGNATRFVVVGHDEPAPTGHDRTSLVFGAPHQRGALKRALECFDREGLNLSRIESRPTGERLGEYVFFLDLEGHQADPPVARALAHLATLSGQVRLLGSYPRADAP